MSDERRRVLDLLAQGKITVDEADQLLRALGATPSQDGTRFCGRRDQESHASSESSSIRRPMRALLRRT